MREQLTKADRHVGSSPYFMIRTEGIEAWFLMSLRTTKVIDAHKTLSFSFFEASDSPGKEPETFHTLSPRTWLMASNCGLPLRQTNISSGERSFSPSWFNSANGEREFSMLLKYHQGAMTHFFELFSAAFHCPQRQNGFVEEELLHYYHQWIQCCFNYSKSL